MDLDQSEKKTRTLTEKILGYCSGSMMILWFLVIFVYAVIQFGAGWAGIDDAFGTLWGWAAAIVAIVFRFTLPITIGAFLFAKNTLEWHWFFAFLFAAPGIIFMVPGLIVALIGVLPIRKK